MRSGKYHAIECTLNKQIFPPYYYPSPIIIGGGEEAFSDWGDETTGPIYSKRITFIWKRGPPQEA